MDGMRKSVVFMFLAAFAFVLSSCQDKGETAEKVSVIKVVETVLKFGPEGGEHTLLFTSVGEAYGKVAEAEVDEDWIEIQNVSSSSVQFAVAENASGQDRSSKLVLSGNGAKPVTVHIIQSKVSDSKPAYRNFTVGISKITSSSACIEVEPLNPAAYYYTDLFIASQYNTYGEAYLAKSMIDYVNNLVSLSGTDDPRVFMYRGYYNTDYDEKVSLDLRDNTDYYVAVLDMDVDESGSIISSGKGEFHKFRTLRASQVEMTFTFDIKGTQVEVTPSANYTYVCGLCTKAQWNAYADANDAARDYIAIAKQYNMLESVVYTGKRTVDFTYLLEKSGEYVVYAVGYRNASTDKGLTTEIQSQVFTYTAK